MLDVCVCQAVKEQPASKEGSKRPEKLKLYNNSSSAKSRTGIVTNRPVKGKLLNKELIGRQQTGLGMLNNSIVFSLPVLEDSLVQDLEIN